MPELKVKRIYEGAAEEDGYRILVDRLWPRGISKERAKIDLWTKEIAPSAELRKWYHHEPEKYPEFRNRYFTELGSNEEAVSFKKMVLQKMGEMNVTLLYSAKDEKQNNAIVLKEWLEE